MFAFLCSQPGKHLAGLELAGGVVKPEEFDYFHELVLNQELTLGGARGYGDGLGGGDVRTSYSFQSSGSVADLSLHRSSVSLPS
jgi:hypothetical protein